MLVYVLFYKKTILFLLWGSITNSVALTWYNLKLVILVAISDLIFLFLGREDC